MKVQMTVEVSDEAMIAIGLLVDGTLTRATRIQTRDFLLNEVGAVLRVQEATISRITAEVLKSTGLELAPLDVNEAASL